MNERQSNQIDPRQYGEAEKAGAPAGHDDFYRSYVLFVDLVQQKAMGGARFTALKSG